MVSVVGAKSNFDRGVHGANKTIITFNLRSGCRLYLQPRVTSQCFTSKKDFCQVCFEWPLSRTCTGVRQGSYPQYWDQLLAKWIKKRVEPITRFQSCRDKKQRDWSRITRTWRNRVAHCWPIHTERGRKHQSHGNSWPWRGSLRSLVHYPRHAEFRLIPCLS